MKHIIHDVDRDGWGSAAMLVAQLGPARCALHPLRGKDVSRVFAGLPSGDDVTVLDLPAPADWRGIPERPVTWVDHHLAAWRAASPPVWIRAILPHNDRPTTTMRLLVEAGLVTLPGVMKFVAGLCRRSPPFEWGLVLDAMRETAPDLDDLTELLAKGPLGQPVPEPLRHLGSRGDEVRRAVEAALEVAPTAHLGTVVRIDLADAKRIPLARYSLAAEDRYPGVVRVLVHRRQRLYVGRDSRRPGIDLITHFQGRGLDPKGHPYVCTVNVAADRIDTEVAELVGALEVER